MKFTSGFNASSRKSSTYLWWKVMSSLYGLLSSVETKGFSISLTVSDLILLDNLLNSP